MPNSTKKRSFFERLTGSIRMEDDEPVSFSGSKKPGLYSNRYEPNYEDDDTVETSVTFVSEEDGMDEEQPEAQLAIDVYETPNEIVVKTMTAGVKKEDLQIHVSRESLTIRGKRENDSRAYQHTYHAQELYWGSFSREIELPEEIDPEQASATEHHGLVTIKLPKFDKKKQTTLKIQ
jgi:HSP20 family protein